ARIQEALISWMRVTAPTIARRRYKDYWRCGHAIQWAEVPGVPFAVRLVRFDNLPGLAGRAAIKHTVEGNLDDERAARMLRACEKKLPKLAGWKREHNARTIFVMEENDIQLTNHVIVADIYLPLVATRDDRPDETYLISTSTKGWDLWSILIGNQSLYDF